MTLRTCPYEQEIRQLLERGLWPQACPAELLAHVEACRSCNEMVLVTLVFRDARAGSASGTPMAQLPPPGVLWWRAQLRRRNAAVERINKPIVGAQIFAFAITLTIGMALVLSQAKQGLHWLMLAKSWLAALPLAIHWEVLWPAGWFKTNMSLVYLAPCLAMIVLLSGVVVYLASEKQ
jgi:hypothetical protein